MSSLPLINNGTTQTQGRHPLLTTALAITNILRHQ